jgi:TetR/AcrR family transcriptional regulator, transcriptional repressor for nem operon
MLGSMAKVSNREKILCEGLKVVHLHGFANASVRDIVGAAGVPQGSFTNHFSSKEAFGLEILNLYFAGLEKIYAETLLNPSLPPLARLKKYLETATCPSSPDQVKSGCLFGNFAAEASEGSEVIRKRLVEIFQFMQNTIASCLKEAVKAKEISAETDCDEIAAFIVTSLQGASLVSKARRDIGAFEQFQKVLFGTILKVKN